MERDPTVGAEALFLARLALPVLLATAFAAPIVGPALILQSLLAAGAVLVLPGTPDRAFALSVVLVIGGALAVRGGGRPREAQGTAASLEMAGHRLMATVLAVQLLLRSSELLNAEVSTIADVMGWAALAAVSGHVLAQATTWRAAALALAVSAIVANGFHAPNSVGIAVLAGAALAFDTRRSRAWRVAGGLLLCSPLVLMSPLMLRSEGGLAALAAASILAPLPALRPVGPLLLLGLGVWRAGAAGVDVAVLRRQIAVLVLVLPQAFLESRDLARKAAALILAGATLLLEPTLAALATPLAAMALCLNDGTRRASLQRVWITALALSTLLLAAPPWYRSPSLPSALARFGVEPGAWALVGLLVFAGLWVASRTQKRLSAAALAAGAIGLALILSAPRDSALLVHRQPVALTDAGPTWAHALSAPRTARTIVLDTNFANSTSAVPGAVLARIRIRSADGDQFKAIRIGEESGEWAVLRDDVAAIPGVAAPPGHLSWVDPSGTFFGQRYRMIWTLGEPTEIEEVELILEPGTPRGLVLTVFHLELRG